MIAKVDWTSDWGGKPEYKEFNTLEGLLAFQQRVGDALIISVRRPGKEDKPHDFHIEVYDDYRE